MTMRDTKDFPKNEIQKLQTKLEGLKYTGSKLKLQHRQDLDLILLEQYKAGSQTAGMELFNSYLDVVSHIYRYPTRCPVKGRGSKARITMDFHTKEDLLQEILYHFFKLVDEYDSECGYFVGIVKGKLHFRVYDNFFADVADKVINEVEYDDTLELLAEGDVSKFPADYVELYQAINLLGARQREVFVRSAVNGWNATEIGEELGIAPATVRVTLKKALKKLRAIMDTEKEVA